jgi:two-component system NtrC family sensor kinase
MIDLTQVQLSDAVSLGSKLRTRAAGAGSLEEASRRLVDHLYNELRQGDERTCALVRFYKTHPYADLEPDLAGFAAQCMGGPPPPASSCLVLMATRGDRPAWNDRRASRGHQAIPLPDTAFIERLPMIAELFRQFGISPAAFIDRDEAALRDLERSGSTIFLVEEAKGSAFIPAQDFVQAAGIRSVLAFGGILPYAQLFSVLLFCRVPVTRRAADLLKPLALNVKLGLLPLCTSRVFD